MCKLCETKVPNGYADRLPVALRPVVDAARAACNQPRISTERQTTVVGGIAASVNKHVSLGERVPTQTLFSDIPHEHALTALALTNVAVLAFETPDDSWPKPSLFDALRTLAPDVTIMRIIHRNGGTQFWSLAEVQKHYESIALAA